MSVEFAQILRSYMARNNNISQRGLATDAGIDHSSISRLLSLNRDATPRVAEGLMEALRVKKKGDRVEFLLFAAGYSEEVVKTVTGHKPKLLQR